MRRPPSKPTRRNDTGRCTSLFPARRRPRRNSGFRGFEIAAVIDDDGKATAEFAATYRLGLSPSGAIHGITLFANGSTGNAPVDSSFEFQSVIDPVFRIDPDASFDVGGVRVRFADAYRLEFSEGVVPFVAPEPSSLVMMLGLGLMIASGAVHRHRTRAWVLSARDQAQRQ